MTTLAILNTITQSPAMLLCAIAGIVVFLAIIGAKFTARKPNDNGLVYEYQKHPRK